MLPIRKTITIVDVETTGASPVRSRVIEIGIVRYEPGAEPVFYSSLVNPGQHIPHSITALTGLDSHDLRRAPAFDEIALEILPLLQDAVFVAHNARFDYAFIKNEFKRLGMAFSASTLCSVQLSRMLYPGVRRHDLSTVIDRFGLKIKNRHRALDDAKAVWQFMLCACSEKGDAFFNEVFEHLLSGRFKQCSIAQEKIDALPETCGVYIFYGPRGEVLYVGKSRNIRNRVRSHFYGDHESSRGLALTQHAADIEVRETAGEISALLLESELVKTLQPLHNRQLRKTRGLVFAVKHINEEGYNEVLFSRDLSASPEETGRIVGVYRSEKQARKSLAALAWEKQLCPKLLGIEKAAKACFSYHLKNCLGACAGQESANSYNLRLHRAFGGQALQRWPYRGAVLIEEYDELQKRGAAFLVKDWRILACIRYLEEDREILPGTGRFELDTYHILCRALQQPLPGTRIRRLSNKELRQWFEQEDPSIEETFLEAAE